jgi:hypothetical protein
MAGDRLPKALTQFGKLSDPQLATYGQTVTDGLGSVAGLALYPTPPFLPAALQTLVTAFVNAMAAAADGGKALTYAKDAAKRNLKNALAADARYVTQVATLSYTDYDQIRTNIAISGYLASVVPSPVSSLPQPEVEFAQSIAIGMLRVQLKAQPGRARGYLAYYKKSTDTNYNLFVSTSSRFDIPSLQSGAIYNVYFNYQGTTNTSTTETDVMNFVIL